MNTAGRLTVYNIDGTTNCSNANDFISATNYASPISNGKIIYFASADRILAINFSNCNDVIFIYTADSDIYSQLSLSNGILYFLSDGGYLYGLGDYVSSTKFKLKENQGSIAYDTSGNGNNGTISGATWNNDGILVTLTNLVDYTIAGKTFTVLTNAWDQVVVSYRYGDSHTVSDMNSNFTKGINNISEKIPTVLLISAVVLLFGVLVLLIAKSRNMGFDNQTSL